MSDHRYHTSQGNAISLAPSCLRVSLAFARWLSRFAVHNHESSSRATLCRDGLNGTCIPPANGRLLAMERTLEAVKRSDLP